MEKIQTGKAGNPARGEEIFIGRRKTRQYGFSAPDVPGHLRPHLIRLNHNRVGVVAVRRITDGFGPIPPGIHQAVSVAVCCRQRNQDHMAIHCFFCTGCFNSFCTACRNARSSGFTPVRKRATTWPSRLTRNFSKFQPTLPASLPDRPDCLPVRYL